MAELVFACAMLAAAGSDLAARRIPNALNLAILVAGLAHGDVLGGLGGAALGLALLLPLFHMRWIGGGDVKLMAATGAWVGATGVVWVTAIGLALGGVVAAAMLAMAPQAMRREVVGNLRAAVILLESPHAPRRARAQMVPLAVALAAAAIGWVFAGGGLS